MKKFLFVSILFSIIALTGVFAFEARNGTFGASGTYSTIKFWTDGNVELNENGVIFRLCGRWVRRGDIIVISFNIHAPEYLRNTQQEFTIIDNDTLIRNGRTWRRR